MPNGDIKPRGTCSPWGLKPLAAAAPQKEGRGQKGGNSWEEIERGKSKSNHFEKYERTSDRRHWVISRVGAVGGFELKGGELCSICSSSFFLHLSFFCEKASKAQLASLSTRSHMIPFHLWQNDALPVNAIVTESDALGISISEINLLMFCLSIGSPRILSPASEAPSSHRRGQRSQKL